MWRRIIVLAVVAVVLYGLAPAILDVFGAFGDLGKVQPLWWIAVVLTQIAASACFVAAQRIALRTRAWFAVTTSQLASTAMARVVPGGAAAAAALQFRMLVQAGMPATTIATGLAAGSILLLAALAGLPVLAIPSLIGGLAVPAQLLEATGIAILLFLGLVGIGAALLTSERIVVWVGEAATAVLRRVRPRRPPPADLPQRLLGDRARVRAALGDRWLAALCAAAGRWLFDFLTLFAALQAVGAHPKVSLTLLAYSAAQLLAQLPLTPGGLGIVEAGLTGTLALIGVQGAAAAVATLAYRLVSYWLLLPVGLGAYLWHRARYGNGNDAVAPPAAGQPG